MEHELLLAGYAAECPDGVLQLGTAESYGIEQLRLVRGDGWAGLALTATFHPPRGAKPVQVRAAADGLADVPPEATAAGGTGEVVITGYEDGVKRCSCGLRYLVCKHGGADADPPAEPTPDLVQQILNATDNAERTANSVREDADNGLFDGETGPQGPQGPPAEVEVLSNLDIEEILNMLD